MRVFPLQSLAATSLLALALSTGAMAGGPFASPKDGPSSFRRDRIPLESGDMKGLAGTLTMMASTVSHESPEDRRLVAQCLALALACDPTYRDARGLLDAMENGHYRPKAHERLNKGLSYAADIAKWLGQDTAGRDAKLLSACLKDVISRVGRDDDRFRSLGSDNMLGDWNDLVPSLAYYKADDQPGPGPGPGPDPGPDPGPLPDPDTGDFKLAFDKAEVTIPMWYRAIRPVNGQNWVLKPGRMFVRAEYDESAKNEPFRMSVGGNIFNEQMENFSRAMTGVLHKSLDGLPGGLRVDISSEALEDALRSGQPQSISAAAVVLAGSVISGKTPNSDTIVLGKVDLEGNYLPSSDMWQQLKAFSGGKGQRMVVPAKSRQYFEAMLTMDQIDYFLNYEVIMASNVQELLNATASQSEGGIGEASTKFAEIQKVAPTTKVRSFVANSHVRKRLEGVVKDSSQHLSGVLLLMQANSSRPFNITREVLCAEMKYMLLPLRQVRAIPWDAAEEREFKRLPVGQLTKEARDKIATLERYVGREERDLYQDVDAVFDVMREYDKALSQRGDYDYITGLLSRTSRNAERAFENYERRLEEAMGN